MLWLANSTSSIGNWFNQVALGLIVLSMTHSSLTMGLVLLCRSLPSVLFGPLLSPMADRYSKRTIMYLCDSFRAIFALLFIIAYQFDVIPLLFLGSFLLGISGVMFSPAQQSTIPLVVEKKDLTNAYAFNSSTSGIISILGALFGGIIASRFSPDICFIVNSLSFALSSLFIFCAKWKEKDERIRQKESYFESIRLGFREVRKNMIVRSVVLIGISWGFAGGAYNILIPLLGQSTYKMGGMGIGLLYSIDGLGIVVGALVVKKYIGKSAKRVYFAFGISYFTQSILLALLAQTSTIMIGMILLFLMRVLGGIIIPLDSFIIQKNTSVHFRARVFSIHDSTYTGVMQLSYGIFGYLFDKLGIPIIGFLVGIVSMLCSLFWLLNLKQMVSTKIEKKVV